MHQALIPTTQNPAVFLKKNTKKEWEFDLRSNFQKRSILGRASVSLRGRDGERLWRQRGTAWGGSASAVFTYSAEVMVGKVVLMQPKLKLMHRAEGTPHQLAPGSASIACHRNNATAERAEWHSTVYSQIPL